MWDETSPAYQDKSYKKIGILVIAIPFIILGAFLAINNIYTTDVSIPTKNINYIAGSQEGNGVILTNTGNTRLYFYELNALLEGEQVTIINQNDYLEPGSQDWFNFSPHIWGEGLTVIIRGPDNQISYIVDIFSPETQHYCGDGLCSEGEDCPEDVIFCEDKKCYTPTCFDGCGEEFITNGSTDNACYNDTGCDGGGCYCDGQGNCVSSIVHNQTNGTDGHYCGDFVCDDYEDCETCEEDCGACYPGSVARDFGLSIIQANGTMNVSIIVTVSNEDFYVIEEFVPVGWSIINPGIGDNSIPRRVTWVEFTNVQDVEYQYRVQAPLVTGSYSFSGFYTLGSNQTHNISGDITIEVV